MTKSILGTVFGSTIRLTTDPGLVNGQEVEVTLRPIGAAEKKWGEGILATAGVLADDPTADFDLDELHQQRKNDFGPEAPE